MAMILLAWHGAVVCSGGGRLFPAPIADVLSGNALPVDPGYRARSESAPLPFEVVIIAPAPGMTMDNTPGHGSIVALRGGALTISCREGETFRAVGHCAQWEHFLALDARHLSVLHAALSRDWKLDNGETIRPGRDGFSLILGQTRLGLSDLSLTEDGQTLCAADKRVATAWPDAAFHRAIEAATQAMQDLQANAVRGRSPWGEPDDLPRQLLLTITDYNEPRHMMFLARLCLLIGLDDVALLCLDVLENSALRTDALILRAILARLQHDEPACQEALIAAITCALPEDAQTPVVIDRFRARLAEPETFLTLWPTLERAIGRPLYPSYEDLLVPGWLPADGGFAEQTPYYHRLEEKWTQCPAERRQIFLNEERRLNGPSHALAILEGHKHWLDGEQEEANALYDTARSLSLQNQRYFIHFNGGVYTWQGHATRPADPHPLSIDSWRWAGLPDEEQDTGGSRPVLTLIAAGDRRYFAFIPGLIASLVQACDGAEAPGHVRLVLGVAHASDEQVAFLKDVASALRREKSMVSLVFAYGSLSHSDGASFSCIRYLIMPRIARLADGPIMTIDMDAMIPVDFLSFARDMLKTYDYGFRLYAYDRDGRQCGGEPWGFGAGVSYFGEKPLLPVIAQALSDYIISAYHGANPTNWCIEQCALSAVYHRHIAPRWATLRIKFMDDPPPLVMMPHHLGMDKKSFSEWTGLVEMGPVYERLGLEAGRAEALVVLT
ncbi:MULTISPECIES: hypothetical protein [Asaia]|uniref:hypothetical protein n=1 Tax=Asaia TaxID=91914 RepID=UPI0025560A6B|nr:hypothetical protein [Asaia sp. HumB]MDL2171653.1 hypothetical protein [Asaia sp. HumB]